MELERVYIKLKEDIIMSVQSCIRERAMFDFRNLMDFEGGYEL